MSATLLLFSYVFGLLTVLAPCVLPLLPVIIGSSSTGNNKWNPYLVITGLVVSITLFTILLKASTLLLQIDPQIWKFVSGGIVLVFGLIYLFPDLWDKFSMRFNLSAKSDQNLEKASKKEGLFGSLLIGAALGPVFSSCSPTYFLIIATILPVSFFEGLLYIIVYSLGLATVMLGIALLSRGLVQRLKLFTNPNGTFKKVLGVLFLIVGISIILGFDKQIETWILDSEFYGLIDFEQGFIDQLEER
jgi:cytochrome c biogenesis protein CcdA